MYPGFCSVIFDNNKTVGLFCGLEDLSVDASRDQFEPDCSSFGTAFCGYFSSLLPPTADH